MSDPSWMTWHFLSKQAAGGSGQTYLSPFIRDNTIQICDISFVTWRIYMCKTTWSRVWHFLLIFVTSHSWHLIRDILFVAFNSKKNRLPGGDGHTICSFSAEPNTVSSGLCANELSQMRRHEWNVCESVVTNKMSRMKCVWLSCDTVYFTNEMCANELSLGICHKRNVCEWVVTNEMSRMKCVWMTCHTVYVTNKMCANEWSSTDGWHTYEFTECHTCESVKSHIWMSHVTHVNETYHEWDVTNEMSRMRCHTHGWAITHM